MSTIDFTCPGCQARYRVPDGSVGRRIRCRNCGRIEVIVEPMDPEPTTWSPSRDVRPSSSRRPRPVRRLAEASVVQGIAVVLVILSVADVFMTYLLLRTSPSFYESNPVAQWFFARWNMAGMVLFKFSVIAAVIAIGEYVERRRPGWGRFVLLIGSVAAAYAVARGLSLYLGHGGLSRIVPTD